MNARAALRKFLPPIASLVALGHPARQVTKLHRAEVEEFTTVDRFDGPAFG